MPAKCGHADLSFSALHSDLDHQPHQCGWCLPPAPVSLSLTGRSSLAVDYSPPVVHGTAVHSAGLILAAIAHVHSFE